ncbi:AAA family ATPase [Microbacterium pumilum]|uniref:AAA family ATPase n=1 Tax=Microbacterium pumilum TaxID=344165 RepID=A0ABP5EF93_9MICO
MSTEVPPQLQMWLDRLDADSIQHTGHQQYKARCPAHDDDHASLSVGWGDKGKVVATCHANCTYSEIVTKLGLTKRDLEPQRKVVARYDYKDEDGVLQYQVTRWEPKSFSQRRPDPAHRGQWINNMDSIEPLPFHLPELAEMVEHGTEDDWLWIVEGEKDVLALETAYGAIATCNHQGAGSWTDPHAEHLIGFKGSIAIVIDNDDKATKPGQKHALEVYESVRRVAGIEAELVYPVEGKDAADVVGKYDEESGFVAVTPDMLRAEIQDASSKNPEADEVYAAIVALFMAEEDARTTLIAEVHSDGDILAMTPPRYAIEGWLPVGFFSDFFGEPGSKKTFVINDQLRHIRAGKAWHGHDVTRGATLLFEGEGLEQLQDRIIAWDEYHGNPEMAPGGHVSTPIDMTTPEGVARVVRTVRDFERAHGGERVVAVAFDPVVEYMNGEENGEGMELVTRGFRALARYLDIAVVLGAHTNASGERARGGDQLRMRAGAHVRVETLKDDRVGLVQEKQKNGERRALQLLPVSCGPSLVLEKLAAMSASEYYADKSNTDFQDRAASKLQFSKTSSVVKHSAADQMLIDYVRDHPGIGKGKLADATSGQGVGKPTLETRIDALLADGTFRVEREGTARNSPSHYFLVETTEEVE